MKSRGFTRQSVGAQIAGLACLIAGVAPAQTESTGHSLRYTRTLEIREPSVPLGRN